MTPRFLILFVLLLGSLSFAGQKFEIENITESNIIQNYGDCDPNPGSCSIVDQSGTLDSWACRNSEGNIRCYADVQYGNGTKLRIWGGCYSSYSDCWSTGAGAVEACD